MKHFKGECLHFSIIFFDRIKTEWKNNMQISTSFIYRTSQTDFILQVLLINMRTCTHTHPNIQLIQFYASAIKYIYSKYAHHLLDIHKIHRLVNNHYYAKKNQSMEIFE